MKLQLVIHPNKFLTTKITSTEYPTVEEAEESYAIMKSHNGIGIAAPQVGLSKRFFWMYDELVINPEIVSISTKKVYTREGCLSLPGEVHQCARYREILVKYNTFLGKINENSYIFRKLTREEAVVFQHEYDHLDGILINASLK